MPYTLKTYKKNTSLFLVLLSSLSVSANPTSNETLKDSIQLLESITPKVVKDCEQENIGNKLEEKKPSLPFHHTLMGFVGAGTKESPIRFFIKGRSDIKGSKEIFIGPKEGSRTNLPFLDAFNRAGGSNGYVEPGSKNLIDFSESELHHFLSNSTTLTEREIDDMIFVMELSKITDDKTLFNTLTQKAKGMSYTRKIQILSAIGSNFVGVYDKARNDQTTLNSKSVVSTSRMFSAIRNSLKTGVWDYAGVCRDMHMSMAKMARAMGIRNAYGISYANRSGGHMILTTTPNHYGEVTLINYGGIQQSKRASGPGTLEYKDTLQPWGAYLTVSDGSSNKDVLDMPTRLATALIQSSGGETDRFIYGKQVEPASLQGGIKTDYGNVILSNQDLGAGSPGEVSSISYQLNKSPTSYLNIDGAIGYFDSTRESKPGLTLYESGLFGRINSTLSQKIKLSSGLSLYGGLKHNYMIIEGCRRTSENPNCVEDDHTVEEAKRYRPYSFLLNGEIFGGLNYNSESIDANIEYIGRIQRLKEDTRDSHSEMYTNVSQHKISGSLGVKLDNFRLLTYGDLVLTDLGDQLVKTYTLGSNLTYIPFDLSVAVEKSGRLESDGQTVPAWLPGSENRDQVRLMQHYQSINGSLGFELQRSQDFPGMNTGFFIYRIGD